MLQMIRLLSSITTSLLLRFRKSWFRYALKKYNVAPGVYQNFIANKIDCVVFNLNSPYASRLGDSLFYVNAINFVASKLDFKVFVRCHRANASIMRALLNDNVVLGEPSDMTNVFQIYPIGCLKNICDLLNKGFIVLDVHNYEYNEPVSVYIKKSMHTLLEFFTNDINLEPRRYIVVSAEVGSQFFMLTKAKINSLLNTAQIYSKLHDARIIFLGTKSLINGCDYFNPDGATFAQFHALLNAEHCLSVFTFDSFIMHYSHKINKRTFVKFRGKLTKFSKLAHYRVINNAYRNDVLYV